VHNEVLKELYEKQKNLKQIIKMDDDKNEEQHEEDGTQRSSAHLSELDLEVFTMSDKDKLDQLFVRISLLTNEDINIHFIRSEIINFEEE